METGLSIEEILSMIDLASGGNKQVITVQKGDLIISDFYQKDKGYASWQAVRDSVWIFNGFSESKSSNAVSMSPTEMWKHTKYFITDKDTVISKGTYPK